MRKILTLIVLFFPLFSYSQQYITETKDFLMTYTFNYDNSSKVKLNVNIELINKTQNDIYLIDTSNIKILCDNQSTLVIQSGVFWVNVSTDNLLSPKLIKLKSKDTLKYSTVYFCYSIVEKQHLKINFDYLIPGQENSKDKKEILKTLTYYPDINIVNRKETYTMSNEVYGKYCKWETITLPFSVK